LCLCATVLAQTPDAQNAAPGIEVVKHDWSKERIGWERDPFSGTNESFSDMRRRAADDRRRERAQATGNIGEANRIEREARAEQVIKARPPAPPRYAFLYKVSVKNTGDKTIKEIDWDYVFTDAATREEIGRRQFTGVEKIAPGKSKELAFLAPSPPAGRISVYALDKKERDGLDSHIVIVRVLYADGTVWEKH
jgi:hypothetical protein